MASDLSSSSGAVFFEKVSCHDPPWLPILSKSHDVFVSHFRPFCDVCHSLRSWPSSASFPLQWTIQQQPVDVVTSDHNPDSFYHHLHKYCSIVLFYSASLLFFIIFFIISSFDCTYFITTVFYGQPFYCVILLCM